MKVDPFPQIFVFAPILSASVFPVFVRPFQLKGASMNWLENSSCLRWISALAPSSWAASLSSLLPHIAGLYVDPHMQHLPVTKGQQL